MKNLKRKIRKSAKRMIASFLLVTTVIWSFGASLTMLTPVAKAAITIVTQPTGMIVSGQTAKATSADILIAEFAISQSASETLLDIMVTISDIGTSGVTGSEIANLKVYLDEGDGVFGAEDLVAGTQTSVNISAPTLITTSVNNTIGETATKFFITLATSGTWSDSAPADAVAVSIAPNGIATSANSPTVTGLTETNALLADTTPLTIVAVEQVNPSAVEVTFSEMVNPNTAQDIGNYTFVNPALGVIDAVQQGPPNICRIVADGAITVGTTTLTVGAGVTDSAGNANAMTTAQEITKPIKIKISEASLEMGSATAEFIEIYNAGSSSQDISGWKLQYKTALGGSFADIVDAVVPASISLAPGKFYLFSTSAFDAVSAIDGDVVYTAELETVGGHVKLIDGSSTEIDKVGWGSFANSAEGNPISVHGAGESFERKAFGGSQASDMAVGGMDDMMGNGWDTGDNSFDFIVQATPNPQNFLSNPEQPNFDSYGGAAGNGPMIMHMPISSAVTGADLNVIAQMGDPMTPIDQIVAELHYMIGDGSPNTITNLTDFTTVLGTHQSNGFFQFTIPQSTVDSSTGVNGLFYYLKVVTEGGTAFMSANPEVNMGTYATTVEQEEAIAINPFIVSVAAAPAAEDIHTISGTVTNDSGGLNGVLVMIEGTGYSATTATADSADGKYSISVPDGIYNITMIKDGYFEEWINDVFVNGGAVTVDRTMYSGTGGGLTGDSEKPMVMWTGPPDGMMGVPSGDSNFKIFIGFSKDLDASTFISSSVYLTTDGNKPGTSLSSGINYDNVPEDNANMPMDPYLGIVNAPTGGFTENTTYYLIMDGTIRDTAGNALQGNRPDGGHMISFTAGGTFTNDMMMTADFGTGAMMPPFVAGTNPYDGAMNVMTNAKININFSDTMDATSVNSTNIKLYKITYDGYSETKTGIDLSSVSLDTTGQNATLITDSALVAGSKYRVVVSGALKSATGIWMGNPGAIPPQNVSTYEFYWSEFEVGSNSDATAPTVIGSWPANSATGISVNPGMMTIQFSEGMDPSTINSNTITLKRGTSAVTGNMNYDPMSQSASFSPSVVLAVNTDYTLTVTTGVKDAVGNAFDSNNVIIFTTENVGDTTDPAIMFANGDEYGVAITFSESMNSASVADATGYLTSVLNPANYVIKWGDPSTVAASGTVIDLSAVGAKFQYDGMSNTVMIDNLGLSYTAGKDYYIDTTSTTVTGAGVADLSGNDMISGSTFQMPINNSFDTQGMLGPMMGGDMMGPDMGMMGMMGAGVFPMNGMAGQTTMYFVDVPTTKVISIGGKIVLTFPVGFDVTNAIKDPYSPVNKDINEWNAGTVTMSVAAVQSTRQVTITTGTADTQLNDFLHMDIKGIVNSSIPRGFETSGYTVDMKTLDASGNLLETISTMPFFINAGGSNSLVVTINGVTVADGGDVSVFLGSPMTGPMEQIATFNGTSDTSKTVTFSNLIEGQYMLFTEPTITLGSTDYSGMPMPQSITISGANTKTISLAKEEAGAGKAAITVNITGIPLNDEIDVFAGSPTGFKVKTLTGTGALLSTILYLPAGDWMVGVGPAMPKGPMAGPPPMPNWMPPMPTTVVSNGTTAQTLAISISTATMEIVGYVQDGAGNAIADAEAFAYQPMGMGMGSNAKTETNGKFTLKVATAGTYSVGVFKPGLPGVPDRTVKVGANESITGGDGDGNSTADITVGGSLITGNNLFIFKIQKSDYTISGKVTNGTNPVSYSPVWAYQPNGMGHAETMTDASGNYILYVANGNWTVQSYVPGFGDSQPQTVVVNGASMTQNLSPDSSVTYYTIRGTIKIGGETGTPQIYMPIRAVEYDSNGNYLGKEYNGQTDASGVYSISVPGSASGKYYRVDIWTPEFGEVELTVTDEVPNNPANVIITTASKANKDITIIDANLKTVTIKFTNGAASQTGMVNIDGANCTGNICNPTGFHKTIKLSALNADSSVKLPAGDYLFFLDVPGAGFFIPDEADLEANTKHCITIVASPTAYADLSLTDNTVEFDLPATTGGEQSVFTVTGKITDISGNIEGAWVWMGNPTTGVHIGDMTDASGDYSITVKAGDYKMGVEMPGFASQQPTNITISADAPNTDYSLVATDQSISGRIYADSNSNGSYTSGEEIANGWVWVEETTTRQIAGAPTELDGTFSIGVVDGTYILRGTAEGYQETKFSAPVTISGSNSSGNNINLTVESGWSMKLKSKPMTPASGGTLDDTLSTGTGIKVVAPPNAFGSETSSGSISTKEVSSVSRTSSANPLGGKGKEITAQNNSGQAITTLNSDIEIELNYYKEDITDAGLVDFDKLKTLTNSYWDVSINDWVPISTTKQAYTKAVGASDNAEWTAQPNFDDFVDDIATYGDYKIALQSTTAHLTIFGATTPSDLTAPTVPTGLAQTSGTGTSVVLDWSNNAETDLLEYEIYRSATSGVTAIDANQVNTSQVAVSTFADSTTTAWTSYYYTITAADDSGNESTVATEIQVCSNSTISNGTVAVDCSITCSDGYTQSGNSCAAQGGGSASGSSTPASDTGQAAATPSAGGTISRTNSDGTSAKVEVPAGALLENATITVSPKAKASITASRLVSAGRSVVGNYIYNFTAVSGLNTSVNTFEKALTLTFAYTNEQAEGLNEETLKIYYWNEASNEWVVLEDSAVDAVNNRVTATTTHFTYFVILGSQTGEETGGEETAPETTPSPSEIVDGDIIQCKTSDNPFAVYIVKIVGGTKYIRHIVSLEIFDYYGHLKWENLKQVDSLDQYSMSGWARYNTGENGTAGPTDKVYEINGDQSKHWINMTAEQFLSHGGSDAAIYSVNQGELNLYATGADVMSL